MNKITEKTQAILQVEAKYASPTTRIPYYPLVVDSALGCQVTDVDGNKFIDFLASAAVINTGHNHPLVVKAIKRQLDKFIHYTPAYLYHEPHSQLMEKLATITPGNFPKQVAFGLSGSSSVDGALKLARAYTGRSRIVSFMRSYHGTTVGALSVSGYSPSMRENMGSLLEPVTFIPYPDIYRPPLGLTAQNCAEGCLNRLKELLHTALPPKEVAAVIYEPIQGDAGVILPSVGFMQDLKALCSEHGILLIADEVQTGFGRTGVMFASELYGFAPDILVLGKAIASGMPLSAIVASKEIMQAWHTPQHFFNTAGNALSCAAALATIEVIEQEQLLKNANSQGEYIVQRFKQMMDKYPCIGDVRGIGLLIGVDIVVDRITKERDQLKTAKICWQCWEKGLILAFFSGSVLRIAPPLVLSREDATKAMDIIEEAIKEVESGAIPDSVLEAIKGW